MSLFSQTPWHTPWAQHPNVGFLHGWSLTCCVRYIWTKENNGPTCISEMTKPPAMNIDDVCLIPKRLRYGRKLKMIQPKALLRAAPHRAMSGVGHLPRPLPPRRHLHRQSSVAASDAQRGGTAARRRRGGVAAVPSTIWVCLTMGDTTQNCLLMGTYSKTSSSLVYPILPYFQTNPYIYTYIYIWYYRIVVLSSRWPLYVQQKIQWKML